MSQCPHCGADVKAEATVCWNCNGSLTGAEGEQPAQQGQQPQNQPQQGQPPQGQYQQGQPQQGQYQQGQPPQGQYGQQPRDGGGVGRRELLAGGGVLAAAGVGGWYFFLREDGSGGSPESPGESYDDAPTVSEGTHGPYQITRGENHYFAVSLEEGERVTATIMFDHDEGDLDLTIANPNEMTVDWAASTSDDETVSVRASQSGTYYINPYGYESAMTDFESEYELEVTIEEPQARLQ